MGEAKLIFEELYRAAEKDPNIIGFFLAGSRGKGREKEYSDYDTYIIVKDEVLEEYKAKYPFREHEGVDQIVLSLTELENDSAWGGPEQFGRYTYAHVKVIIDKINRIQDIIDQKTRVPPEKLSKFIPLAIDAYVNFFYRSLKCIRDGDIPAARLEAAYSIPPFLNVIFAIHGGRLSPYYKYLRWELEDFPLEKFPMNADEIIDTLMTILDSAECETQQKLMKITEEMCRKEGFGFQFDGWGDDYTWMMNYKPKKA